MTPGTVGFEMRRDMRKPGTLLQYKVVELSTVDEGTLEHTVNHWVQQGWNLDGVQFAMRESSKRPSMAFVFFTRDEDAPSLDEDANPNAQGEQSPRPWLPGQAVPDANAEGGSVTPLRRPRGQGDARTWGPAGERDSDPWARLRKLAEDEDGGEGGDDDGGGDGAS